MDQKKLKKSSKITRIVPAMAIVFLIVSLVSVIILILTVRGSPKVDPNKETCLRLGIGEHDGMLSCGSLTEMLGGFLNDRVKENYEYTQKVEDDRVREYCDAQKVTLMQLYEPYLQDMKPTAKLTGSKDEQLQGPGDLTTITSWSVGRHQQADGYQRHGVRYRNGRLMVPVTGTYFIHSFLDLYEVSEPEFGEYNSHDTNTTIVHAMFKYNLKEDVETEIISSAQAHKASSNTHFNYHGSYVSTLVRLQAGEEISVKISNTSLLWYPQENFFGLHLL